MKPQKLPEIHVPTREECRVSCHNSRRALFSPPQVEMRVDSPASSGKVCNIPVAPEEEAGLNLIKERNPGFLPQFERHGYPHPLEIRSDSIAQIRMEPRESTRNMKGGLIPWLQIREKPQVPNSTRLEA